MSGADPIRLSSSEFYSLEQATGATRYVLQLVFKDLNEKRKQDAEKVARYKAEELEHAQRVLAKASGAECCCDLKRTLQPCGPCRFNEHNNCAGTKATS